MLSLLNLHNIPLNRLKREKRPSHQHNYPIHTNPNSSPPFPSITRLPTSRRITIRTNPIPPHHPPSKQKPWQVPIHTNTPRHLSNALRHPATAAHHTLPATSTVPIGTAIRFGITPVILKAKGVSLWVYAAETVAQGTAGAGVGGVGAA